MQNEKYRFIYRGKYFVGNAAKLVEIDLNAEDIIKLNLKNRVVQTLDK